MTADKPPKCNLRLDWCSHEAAKYAVEHWHYSGSMPPPPLVKIGAWEDEQFIGVVLFSRGANNNLLKPYGLQPQQGCELTRIALAKHSTPVSRIIAVAIRMLRRHSPGLRLIVSFADQNEHHHGGIYQASNWLYAGEAKSTPKYRDAQGRMWHQRQTSKTGVKPQFGQMRRVPLQAECVVVPQLNKHRYLMPLDDEMRR